MIRLQNTISLSKNSVWCDLTGEVVVLHVTSGFYFGLDGVGREIWEFLHTPKTVVEVVDHLLSVYDVPRDTCERQVLALLDKMATAELVHVNTDAVVA